MVPIERLVELNSESIWSWTFLLVVVVFVCLFCLFVFTDSICMLLTGPLRVSLFPDLIWEDYMFPGMYTFPIVFLDCVHRSVHSSSKWSYFRGVSCNVSSFISNCTYLNLLSSWLTKLMDCQFYLFKELPFCFSDLFIVFFVSISLRSALILVTFFFFYYLWIQFVPFLWFLEVWH